MPKFALGGGDDDDDNDGKVLNRKEREHCWRARDELLECLEALELDDVAKQNACSQFRALLQKACPRSWVELGRFPI